MIKERSILNNLKDKGYMELIKRYQLDNTPITKQTTSEIEAEDERIAALHDFYKIKLKPKGEGAVSFEGIIINKVAFIRCLKSLGFSRYDMNLNSIKLIQINDNLVTEVTPALITDAFLDYVYELPNRQIVVEGSDFTITPNYIESKIFDSLNFLFQPVLLQRLRPDKEILFKKDDRYSKFIYYQNSYLIITKNKTEIMDYSKLDSYIWSNQLLNRNYRLPDKEKSVFEKFCYIIASEDENRFKSLKTIIGYLLHNNIKGKLHAIVFTDSAISEENDANGRTGKTLLAKGLSHMLNTNESFSSVYCEISGRSFDIKNKHRYETANLDTQLIHLNDLYNNFNIEYLFTDITEGIEVNKKNEKPFRIYPKFILSSNKTLKIQGESAKDRVIVFQFSDFFNATRSPAMHFGHWFFDDWNEMEWARFDGFMISCIQTFLTSGLIQSDNINLDDRNLIDHTDIVFIKWFDYRLSSQDDFGERNLNQIIINDSTVKPEHCEHRINKKDLYNEFTLDNPDFLKKKMFSQRIFTRWIKYYIQMKLKDVELIEKRSGGTETIILRYLPTSLKSGAIPEKKSFAKQEDMPF
ncbi:hypothetical protein ACFLRZ_04725 [Bacteroidota bacterium]